MLVRELAAFLNAPWEGEGDRELLRVAALEEAGPDAVSFVGKGKELKLAPSSRAGCLLAPEDYSNSTGRTIIRVTDPRAAAARAIAKLHPKSVPPPGVHPTAVLGSGVLLGPGVHIGAFVSIGASVRVGEGTVIGPGATIGDGVVIGGNTTIHARVSIYPGTTIGDHVVLHSGCVIGADGFGYVLTNGVYENFPQIGRVEIGDRVEIGANACVDRAALGVTVIGEGTKLDNMVHVGHNCRIGKHVVIAAQTGVSGGVVVEDYVVIAGQVGIADKVRIESRAVLGAQCGVPTSKIIRGGQVVWGTPARPIKEYLEQLALLGKLAKKKPAG